MDDDPGGNKWGCFNIMANIANKHRQQTTPINNAYKQRL
jgi:hypothetical protein